MRDVKKISDSSDPEARREADRWENLKIIGGSSVALVIILGFGYIFGW